MNHGSFGTVPLKVREKRLEWLDKIEAHTDYYMVEALQETLDAPLSPSSGIALEAFGPLTAQK